MDDVFNFIDNAPSGLEKGARMSEKTYQELCSDKEFMARAIKCADANELKALAAEFGLDGTADEAAAAFDKLREMTGEGELQKEELDSVSGGFPNGLLYGNPTC